MEDFVTYKLAKKLKEAGFRKPCVATYDKDGMLGYNYVQPDNIRAIGFDECLVYSDDCFVAPTISQVLKWLREKDFYINIIYLPNSEGFMWQVFDKNAMKMHSVGTTYLTYEETAIAGIEYYLETF